MDIDLVKILINTALFAQSLLIQAVIFPGFLYYSEESWKVWQRNLAMRMTIVMVPLMLAQMITYSLSLVAGVTNSDILSIVLILVGLAVTFYIGFSWYERSQAAEDSMELRKSVQKIIWIRTLAWSLILIISLMPLFV